MGYKLWTLIPGTKTSPLPLHPYDYLDYVLAAIKLLRPDVAASAEPARVCLNDQRARKAFVKIVKDERPTDIKMRSSADSTQAHFDLYVAAPHEVVTVTFGAVMTVQRQGEPVRDVFPRKKTSGVAVDDEECEPLLPAAGRRQEMVYLSV